MSISVIFPANMGDIGRKNDTNDTLAEKLCFILSSYLLIPVSCQ